MLANRPKPVLVEIVVPSQPVYQPQVPVWGPEVPSHVTKLVPEVTQPPTQPSVQTSQVTKPPKTPSSVKSSSSTSSELCTICIKCTDDKNNEQEMDMHSNGPTYPEFDHPPDLSFQGFIEPLDDPDDPTSQLRLNEASRDTDSDLDDDMGIPKVLRRINGREFSVCGCPAMAPRYSGWEKGKPKKAWETYGYRLRFSPNRCAKYGWDLLTGSHAPSTGSKSDYACAFLQ